MGFDYVTAARVAGVNPGMYANEAQMRKALQERAQGDVEFRKRLVQARSAAQADMARQQREQMFGAPTAVPSMMWRDRQAQILQRLRQMNGGVR